MTDKKEPPRGNHPLGGLLKDWDRPGHPDKHGRGFKTVMDFGAGTVTVNSTLPSAIPDGYVLAHNHVRRAVDMPHGRNGFRCWIWPKGKVPRGWKRCECGWSGLPHYRASWLPDKRAEAWAARYRCDSWKAISRF